MKKWKQITLAAFLCTWVVTSSQSTLDLRANEFEGNEDAWVKRCSVAQSSSEMHQNVQSLKHIMRNKAHSCKMKSIV